MNKTVKAILIRKDVEKPSKHGGTYIRTYWKDCDDNTNYILDVVPQHFRSKRFIPYLELQNILTNLSITKIRGSYYINGNSDFNFSHNKSKKHV